jgi:hypothetical protein
MIHDIPICSCYRPGNHQLAQYSGKNVLYGVSSNSDQWYWVSIQLANNTCAATDVPSWSTHLVFFDRSDVTLTREISRSGPMPVLFPSRC